MEEKIQTIATLRTKSFSVDLDEVRLKNGAVSKRVKIHHPEAVAVIPFISDHEILLVRQFRYALGRETLEIPAGKVDPGESLEACARRELLEETGHTVERIEFLYTFTPAIGYSNERIHIYLGHHLKRTDSIIDEREISSVERRSLHDLERMITEGLIQDAKTLIGLLLVASRPSF